ncbi:MAG: exodeoxyribonuclease III [Rhodospirillales bacterium]|nr:exodeoxyribonuclease III [Alphaproteobacteria bacterium]MCB9986411.1 exodeoxyribonuclease III [Rhodospirillales bacterium]USO08613.1 MAG: exodeoxyribonuclease III [Rhodospirillales bacterium]
MTWNINSVRLRHDLVRRAIEALAPDIVCLQETKTPDELFPADAFRACGFAHMHVHGMKGYNGVAILSRTPFTATRNWDRVGKSDCRHAAVEIAIKNARKPLHIHNLYVPAGGDIPDVQMNEKFAHKLAFVDETAAFFKQSYARTDALIALGDFNIAPLEHDVWSHRQLLDVVSHTPVEVEKLGAMQASLGFVDAIRSFVPADQKLYTWWSYRNRDWKASNRGRRLDHVWVTPALKNVLRDHTILKDARDWQQTSDHVPVLLDLDLDAA